MANDLNLYQCIGRIGKDVELKYMKDGRAVVSVSLAVGKTWKDKSGVKREKTAWVPVVFFDKLAEIISRYAKKGSRLYISGELEIRKGNDSSGAERYYTEIVGKEMQLLDSKGQQSNSQERQQEKNFSGGPDDFDEDLPF